MQGQWGILTKAGKYYGKLLSLAKEDDLKKASKCSNPTIRSYAIVALLTEIETDPLHLAIEHIFDSAKIFDDYDNQKWSVISFLLHHTHKWKSKEDRNKIERMLLENRPFESAAFDIVNPERATDTFPGFYLIVKSMAKQVEEYMDDETIDLYYGIHAINRLATYQRKEDIPLLDSLLDYSVDIGNGHYYPFFTIKHFPAPEFEHFYLDISEHWYRQFRFLNFKDYLGYYEEYSGIEDFIDLVIDHRSARSARLLEKMLEYSPYHLGGVGGLDRIKYQLEERMYRHIALSIRIKLSPYYAGLMKKTEKYLTEHDLR